MILIIHIMRSYCFEFINIQIIDIYIYIYISKMIYFFIKIKPSLCLTIKELSFHYLVQPPHH